MTQHVRILREHLAELEKAGRDIPAILARRDYVYDELDRPWVFEVEEGDLLKFVPASSTPEAR